MNGVGDGVPRKYGTYDAAKSTRGVHAKLPVYASYVDAKYGANVAIRSLAHDYTEGNIILLLRKAITQLTFFLARNDCLSFQQRIYTCLTVFLKY